jgi:TonB family protein
MPDSYRAMLLRRLRAAHRYPEASRWRREEGTAMIRFTIARDGRILGARIERGSGHAALDEAALALPARISPVPPLPAEFAGPAAEIVAPIAFVLR